MATWIGVYGLDILTRTDSSGKFTLNGLPAGDIRLFALTALNDSVIADTGLVIASSETTGWIHTVSVPSADTSDSLATDTSSADTAVWMLYEDFEDSASFAAKGWYFSADTLSSISSPVGEVWNGVVLDSNRRGSEFVFEGYYSTVFSSWVTFGNSISESGLDLSALDSITLYAKGSGYIRVALERWEADASAENFKAWTDNIALSSVWTRICVTPDKFLLPENDSLSTGWDSVKKTVTRFHIFGIGGTELGLDDIRVYGVTF